MYNIYNRYDDKNSFLKKLTFMKKSCTVYNNSDALQS